MPAVDRAFTKSGQVRPSFLAGIDWCVLPEILRPDIDLVDVTIGVDILHGFCPVRQVARIWFELP